MAISDYAPIYQEAGKKFGVPPELLMAQGYAEDASGDPTAVGPDTPYGNAVGVSQFIPTTAKSLGVNPKDPKSSIFGQARLLKENIDRYGNIPDAISAYHGGTDKSTWGPKTKAYQGKVMDKYQQQLAQNSDSDLLSDYELSSSTGGQTQSASAPADEHPEALHVTIHPMGYVPPPSSGEDLLSDYELPKKEGKKVNSKGEPAAKPTPSVAADVIESLPDTLVKGVGTIPQFLPMGVNALTNVGGYLYGKATGASPELQHKLSNLNPLFTGNTLSDTLAQGIQAAATGQTPIPNPVTNNLTHEPETPLGKIISAGEQMAIAGPAAGIKTMGKATGNANLAIPSLRAGVAGQLASSLAPDNPLAPLVAGTVAGLGPTAAKSANFRTQPDEIANKVLQGHANDKIEPNALTTGSVIPGVVPTLSTVTGDPNIAALERNQRMQPGKQAPYAARDKANQEARENYYEKASGTPQDIEDLRNDRKTTTEPLYQTAGKQPLDPTAIKPVLDKFDQAIEDVGEHTDAGAALIKLKKKFEKSLPSIDDNGKVKNPTQSPLIQAFREERDKAAESAIGDDAYADAVKTVVQPLIREVGQALESQSPEFAKAQQTYRDISPKIDAATWLQSLRLKDAGGKYTLQKVKTALDKTIEQQAKPGLNKAKSVTPDQVEILQNLYDDLQKQATPARESLPVNSTTHQNELMTESVNSGMGNKLTGGRIPELGGALIGSHLGSLVGWPSMGTLLGEHIGAYSKARAAKKAESASGSIQEFLLNPEKYKQYLLDAQNNNFSSRFHNNLLGKP